MAFSADALWKKDPSAARESTIDYQEKQENSCPMLKINWNFRKSKFLLQLKQLRQILTGKEHLDACVVNCNVVLPPPMPHTEQLWPR